jgi:hypothetical protein
VARHRAVAGWIERVAGDRIADHAELLACATRLGRPSARDHLDQAAELFGQLRAPGLLAETGR